MPGGKQLQGPQQAERASPPARAWAQRPTQNSGEPSGTDGDRKSPLPVRRCQRPRSRAGPGPASGPPSRTHREGAKKWEEHRPWPEKASRPGLFLAGILKGASALVGKPAPRPAQPASSLALGMRVGKEGERQRGRRVGECAHCVHTRVVEGAVGEGRPASLANTRRGPAQGAPSSSFSTTTV